MFLFRPQAVGGNVMTGSPISDLNPILMAAGVKLNVCSLKNGTRLIPMDHTFFKGYRQNVVSPEEILLSIQIPFTEKVQIFITKFRKIWNLNFSQQYKIRIFLFHFFQNQYFIAYKQARRRDDDIAIVNMALNVFFKPETNTVERAYLAYGGMAPTTVLVRKTCENMIGRCLNKIQSSLMFPC